MIRLFYITRNPLEAESTNMYNTAKTCEALVAAGISVTLVSAGAPYGEEDFFDRHHITRRFALVGLGVAGKSFLKTNTAVSAFLHKNRENFDVLYLRDERLFPSALCVRLLGKHVFFEIHSVLVGWHRQLLNRLMMRIAHGIIAISGQLARYYRPYGKPTLVSFCGADESFWFDHTKSKEELRRKLGLPMKKFIVGYVGRIGLNPNNDVYEIDDVIAALSDLPERVVFVGVGEREGNGEWLREAARAAGVSDRVTILPWQNRPRAAEYLSSFDVIVVPRRRKDMPSDSPLKMFSALSAGRPIVAGKSPAITEVLEDSRNALIVHENGERGWAEKIRMLFHDPNLAQRLGKRALADSKKYTWEGRGSDISRFIESAVSKTIL